MNNDQFKLQIYHNRYTRGVVVAICKIIIWSLIYALVVVVTISVLGQDLSSNVVSSYYSPNSGPTAGVIFANLIIFAATIAYYWAVIYEIVRKIKQNKKLTEIENNYLNDGKLKD